MAERLAANTSPDLVGAWCRYAERHAGMGAGALITAIRSGTPPPEPRRSVMDEQREYGERLVAWLEANMPEVCRPVHGPHPAAVAELIRLLYRHGRQAVTVERHGARIRHAVSSFEREMSQ